MIESICELITVLLCTMIAPFCAVLVYYVIPNILQMCSDEWISVEDRLPDNENERVLVFLKDADFTKPIGFNKIDTDRYIDGKWVRWGRYVTHWMPLPDAPKMKGGK